MERWNEAATVYRDEAKAGRYRAEHESMNEASLKKVEELAELLKAFFNVQNPEWQALRRLLSHSGKDVIVKTKEKSDLVVWYILGKHGFRLELDLRHAFEQHRHPEDQRPIIQRKIAPKDMARFLVKEWEMQCETAENIFEHLMQIIDLLAMSAPISPNPDDDLY